LKGKLQNVHQQKQKNISPKPICCANLVSSGWLNTSDPAVKRMQKLNSQHEDCGTEEQAMTTTE